MSSPSRAVASGSCPAPATTPGKAGAIWVPRRERSTQMAAVDGEGGRKPSHFGSATQARGRAGLGTVWVSIGSGRVHVTGHAFHPAAVPSRR
ncbi:hypothetical protein O1Q96_00665 (plasmid) [Streptomyces sp. Qhu-G9]|uniref:hypothetical protein n=1 Tax=Streptomyces sp. Qhu-G9 TaxID=3452799 RepID=UPI0022ABDB11|nr:hypothetical protein [Streptomyces aurantiacus]WAU78391.1 hypothetical protein O1Q96_00665 [Streptomyces aurantiacus]